MSFIKNANVYLDESGAGSLGVVNLNIATTLNNLIAQINAPWTAWTPDLAWTGTGSSASVMTCTSYYNQIGSLCVFNISLYVATIGSGNATALKISLPSYGKVGWQIAPYRGRLALAAIQQVHTNFYNPLAYIVYNSGPSTAASDALQFRSFQTIGTNAFGLDIEGFYEVAV